MVWIVLTTILVLLVLYWLPEITLGDTSLRRIDLLSDVRGDSVLDSEQDSDLLVTDLKVRIDTCRPGMTCIEDMADSTEQGMTPLYDALTYLDTLGRPVRIAVLGDSFIEGDILSSNLREMLQKRYGGCGVGFVPMTCDGAGFRRSVRHSFNGWNGHHANEASSNYERSWSNLTGHYFDGERGATVTLTGVTKYLSLLDTCQSSSFYFMGNGAASASVSINGEPSQQFTASASGDVQSLTVTGNIGKVQWSLSSSGGGMKFLGVSMDCTKGVVVDNYSLRASSGLQLCYTNDKWLSALDACRHYDLVIIMYGLNVAGRQSSKYESYQKQMVKAINIMKQAMPKTGFLVVSVADREERSGGGYRTIAGVRSLIPAQKQIAYDAGVAFWNLYEAMGGEGSMVRLVEKHQANLDYTHINFNGGAVLAKPLFDAIVWGQENYQRQVKKGGGRR